MLRIFFYHPGFAYLNRIIRFVSLTILSLGTVSLFSADPEPFDQDEYSGKSIETVSEAYQIIKTRFFNAPVLGSQAPAFELKDGKTGKSVTLKSLHAEKPVVLFFGSLGCDVFRGSVKEIIRMSTEHSDKFNFVMVYIREAHSLSGFGPEIGKIEDPLTDAARSEAAKACAVETSIPFQILIDSVEDRTATRWSAWPVRLFVVGQDGKLLYSGMPGPWGFHPGGNFIPEMPPGFRTHPDRFSQNSLEDFLKSWKIEASR